MIILSVDYGDKRTGIAVCDKNEILASPVTVIYESDVDRLCQKIVSVSEEYKAEMILIGLPKNMDSTEGFRAEACKALGEKLGALTDKKIDFWDERLTTVSAYTYLSSSNVYGKKRKNVVDAVAANIILQDYIDSRKTASV